MTDEQRKTLEAFFSTYDGEKILEILREMSGYDRRVSFQPDARREAYDLGRASVFSDILSAIKPVKKARKNGRTSEPEY